MANRTVTATAQCPANAIPVPDNYTIEGDAVDVLEVVSYQLYDVASYPTVESPLILEDGHNLLRGVATFNRLLNAFDRVVLSPGHELTAGAPAETRLWAQLVTGVWTTDTVVIEWDVSALRPAAGQPTLVVNDAKAYVASYDPAHPEISINSVIVLPAFQVSAAATPTLSVTPLSFSPSVTEGNNAVTSTAYVSNTSGSSVMAYTVSSNQAWVSPQAGSESGTTYGSVPNPIPLVYSTTGLAVGSYSATVTVAAPGATGSPKNIAVALTVSAAVALFVQDASTYTPIHSINAGSYAERNLYPETSQVFNNTVGMQDKGSHALNQYFMWQFRPFDFASNVGREVAFTFRTTLSNVPASGVNRFGVLLVGITDQSYSDRVANSPADGVFYPDSASGQLGSFGTNFLLMGSHVATFDPSQYVATRHVKYLNTTTPSDTVSEMHLKTDTNIDRFVKAGVQMVGTLSYLAGDILNLSYSLTYLYTIGSTWYPRPSPFETVNQTIPNASTYFTTSTTPLYVVLAGVQMSPIGTGVSSSYIQVNAPVGDPWQVIANNGPTIYWRTSHTPPSAPEDEDYIIGVANVGSQDLTLNVSVDNPAIGGPVGNSILIPGGKASLNFAGSAGDSGNVTIVSNDAHGNSSLVFPVDFW